MSAPEPLRATGPAEAGAAARPAGRDASLDTLRGVAILMVIVFHVGLRHPPVPSWLGDVTGAGNLGVQLFFLVSATTMCLMWDARAHEPRRTARFYVRRVFRIAPLFWLAMLLYQLWPVTRVIALPPAPRDWHDIALTTFFLHGVSPGAINRLVPGGWSIAVEMSFYLVFPLLAALRLGAWGLLVMAFGSFLVVSVGAGALVLAATGDTLFVYYSMLTQLPVFFLGMALHRVAIAGERPDAVRVAVLLLVWTALAFALRLWTPLPGRPFFWGPVLVMAGLSFEVLRRHRQSGPLAAVGRWSYSMYLLHFAVIEAAEPLFRRLPGAAAFWVAVAGVVAVTALLGKASQRSFERWSIDAARRVAGRLR